MCACPRPRALIHHPLLDRTVEVPSRAVRIYERSGWQRVTATPPDPEIDELDDAIEAAEFAPFADEPVDDSSPTAGESTEPPDQEV